MADSIWSTVAPDDRAIDGGRADRSVNDVVDLVILQGEHFGQATANLVQGDHRRQGLSAIEPAQLRPRDRHGIEVVVAEFAARVAAGRVVAEVRPIGIPLPHRRAVGQHGLLGHHALGRTQARHPLRVFVLQRLAPQHRGGVRAAGQGRHAAGDAVEMQSLDHAIHRIRRPGEPAAEKIDRVLGNPAGLVLVTRKRQIIVGHVSGFLLPIAGRPYRRYRRAGDYRAGGDISQGWPTSCKRPAGGTPAPQKNRGQGQIMVVHISIHCGAAVSAASCGAAVSVAGILATAGLYEVQTPARPRRPLAASLVPG